MLKKRRADGSNLIRMEEIRDGVIAFENENDAHRYSAMLEAEGTQVVVPILFPLLFRKSISQKDPILEIFSMRLLLPSNSTWVELCHLRCSSFFYFQDVWLACSQGQGWIMQEDYSRALLQCRRRNSEQHEFWLWWLMFLSDYILHYYILNTMNMWPLEVV